VTRLTQPLTAMLLAVNCQSRLSPTTNRTTTTLTRLTVNVRHVVNTYYTLDSPLIRQVPI